MKEFVQYWSLACSNKFVASLAYSEHLALRTRGDERRGLHDCRLAWVSQERVRHLNIYVNLSIVNPSSSSSHPDSRFSSRCNSFQYPTTSSSHFRPLSNSGRPLREAFHLEMEHRCGHAVSEALPSDWTRVMKWRHWDGSAGKTVRLYSLENK